MTSSLIIGAGMVSRGEVALDYRRNRSGGGIAAAAVFHVDHHRRHYFHDGYAAACFC